jgi:hypothetical protein
MNIFYGPKNQNYFLNERSWFSQFLAVLLERNPFSAFFYEISYYIIVKILPVTLFMELVPTFR